MILSSKSQLGLLFGNFVVGLNVVHGNVFFPQNLKPTNHLLSKNNILNDVTVVLSSVSDVLV